MAFMDFWNDPRNKNMKKVAIVFAVIVVIFILFIIFTTMSCPENFEGYFKEDMRGGRRGGRRSYRRYKHNPRWNRGLWRPYRRFLRYGYPAYTYYGYPYGYPWGSPRSIAESRAYCRSIYNPAYYPRRFEQCMVNDQLGVYA